MVHIPAFNLCLSNFYFLGSITNFFGGLTTWQVSERYSRRTWGHFNGGDTAAQSRIAKTMH